MSSEAWIIFGVSLVVDAGRWFAIGRTAEGRIERERLRGRMTLAKMRTWLLIVAFIVVAGFTTLLAAARSLELHEPVPDQGLLTGLTVFMTLSAVLTAVFFRGLAIRLWRANRAQRDQQAMGRT